MRPEKVWGQGEATAEAVWVQAIDPKSDGAARDWVAIYDECSRILYQVLAAPACTRHCSMT